MDGHFGRRFERELWDKETLKKLDLPGTALTIFGIGMFCAALRYVFELVEELLR